MKTSTRVLRALLLCAAVSAFPQFGADATTQALMEAAFVGDLDVVKQLLSGGVPVNVTDEGSRRFDLHSAILFSAYYEAPECGLREFRHQCGRLLARRSRERPHSPSQRSSTTCPGLRPSSSCSKIGSR